MNIQRVLGTVFLIGGILYGSSFLKTIFKKEDGAFAFRKSPGSLPVLMVCEGVVFFLCTLGISDFLNNTLIIRKLKLSDDRLIPQNLIATTIVPGSVVAFSFLRENTEIDITTLVVFMICLAIGGIAGSAVQERMNGETVKRIIGVCLILSIIAVIIRMVISSGASGEKTGLRGWFLVLLGILCLLMGFINLMGVPMKPTAAAVLLLLGMSPIVTLTLLQVLGTMTPLSGGIRTARGKEYNKKMVLSGMTAGTLMAIVGVNLAISMNQIMLNIILIAVMGIAVFSLLHKDGKSESA